MEKDKISCWCNDELIVELADPEYDGSIVGLASFPRTSAEFKQFQLAERIAASKLPDAPLARLKQTIAKLPLDNDPLKTSSSIRWLKMAPESTALLRDQARQLEKQAEQLRKLAQAVHQQRYLGRAGRDAKGEDKSRSGPGRLARGPPRQRGPRSRRLSAGTGSPGPRGRRRLAQGRRRQGAARALNKFLFKERGFHGSRLEYYSRSNSYLNEVIDDREGMPITLSVLYIELARRLEAAVVGLGLPGHFMVRHEPAKGKRQIIDASRRQVPDRCRKSRTGSEEHGQAARQEMPGAGDEEGDRRARCSTIC